MVEALDMFSSAVCVCDPLFTTLSVPNALELLGVTEYAEKLMQVCHFQERTGSCEEDSMVRGIVNSSCVWCAHP